MTFPVKKIPRDRGYLLDVNYTPEPEFIPSTKLKNGKFIIGRIIYLTNQYDDQTGRQNTKNKVVNTVASELQKDWIEKNVYPKTIKAIRSQILGIYDRFRYLKKKVNENKLIEEAKQFNISMTKNAYNLRTEDSTSEKNQEKLYQIKMKDEDHQFYIDNCFGSYTFTCGNVDKKWDKQRKRNEKRKERKKSESKEKFCPELSSDSDEDGGELQENFMDEDEEYKVRIEPSTHQTRSKTSTITSKEENESKKFPEVEIRSSDSKYLNEKIMRCLVQCFSETKVSANDLIKIVVSVANDIFDQDWKMEGDWNGEIFSSESESEEEKENSNMKEVNPVDEKKESDNSKGKKRSRRRKNKTKLFPSRRSLNKWLEDASYLNMKMVADEVLHKENKTVTVGIDDTQKAAGHKSFDIKTDHITIQGPDQKRKFFTLGFTENISHEGKVAAECYEYRLKCLAVLCNSSVEEIKDNIDFWLSDRAGDCGTMLEHLQIEDEKLVKCSAHIILGADNAADKVFKNVESQIGVHKLMSISAGDKIYNASTSIHRLGQLALTKLLSPSHADHSVSLYNQFIEWLQSRDCKPAGFKGFKSNRFGRIALIAKQYLNLRENILAFFESCVDENSNKLVLAVSTYIESEWFLICTEVYSELADLFIFPLMDQLGIDVKKKKNNGNKSSWKGVKDFFDRKIPELKVKVEELKNGDGKLLRLKVVVEEF